jgi:predicted secreted protein
MAATLAGAGYSTTLMKGAVAIAELQTISGPNMSADAIDCTSHDSDNMFREFIAGIKDGGEISIEGNAVFSDAGQIALYTDLVDGSIDAYTITYTLGAGAPTITFNALVTAFATEAPYDDKLSFSATLKVTGKPTLTP